MSPPPFSLRRRVQLCIAMLALESFISFEEIFMLAVLQRADVPTFLISLPGTISSFIGIFVIPFLGWASDRVMRCTSCGQRRPFAFLTLTVAVVGLSILIGVNMALLYTDSEDNTDDVYSNISSTEFSPVTGCASDLSNLSKPLSSFSDGFVTTSTLNPDSAALLSTVSDYFSEPATYMTVLGVLGIIGFAVSDNGYDSSMSMFKTYMIAVTPASQHDDILVLETLTGAVGGCVTSLLGFVDLTVLLPQGQGVMDKGIGQCLVQSVILLAELVLLGTCSLLTGSESPASKMDAPSSSPCDPILDESGSQRERESEDKDQEDGSQCSETPSANVVANHEKSQLLPETNSGNWARSWVRGNKRLFLCVMTFLGLCTNYAYFVYITNYVGEVIYNGDPLGDMRSDAYEHYVEGVHIASLGMLTFYCLFVGFNLLHNKVLKKIGLRGEYLGASIACCVLMLTLAFTNNIVVFFANAVTFAVFRSAVYTIPFILSNNYARQDQRKFQSGDRVKAGSGSSQTGVAMASVTAMIPASYFLVSLIMGPLMDVTGYPGTPIFIAVTCCLLGIVSAFFVQFE